MAEIGKELNYNTDLIPDDLLATMAITQPNTQNIEEIQPSCEQQLYMQEVVLEPVKHIDPSFKDIYCCKITPQLDDKSWQKACGLCQSLTTMGICLSSLFGCYGCRRKSCFTAFCAGLSLTFSSMFIYGYFASVVIGIKMMCL